jgi:DNA polymerase III alpha subunit
VKFDFLGLKTLTVLDKAVRLINRRPDRQGEFDLSALPLDDRGTYALPARARPPTSSSSSPRACRTSSRS